MFPLHDVRYLQRNAQGASRNSINRSPWDRTGRAQAQSQFEEVVEPMSSQPRHDQNRLAKPLRGRGGARRDRTDDLKLAKLALSQLSYGPEPEAGLRQRREWWAWEDLNLRPHAYQARALTN